MRTARPGSRRRTRWRGRGERVLALATSRVAPGGEEAFDFQELVLLVLAVHWPPLAAVLSLRDPGLDGWGLALAASLVPLVVGQVALIGRRGPSR